MGDVKCDAKLRDAHERIHFFKISLCHGIRRIDGKFGVQPRGRAFECWLSR